MQRELAISVPVKTGPAQAIFKPSGGKTHQQCAAGGLFAESGYI